MPMLENLAYDPESPSGLVWTRPKNSLSRIKAGQQAGCKDHRGYWVVTVNRKRLYGHRVAWELNHGPLAEGLVADHIDRNKSNNRLENLRLVSQSENRRNRVIGTGRHARQSSSGKWWSYFTMPVSGKYIHVGTYKTGQEAHITAVARRLELYWVI